MITYKTQRGRELEKSCARTRLTLGLLRSCHGERCIKHIFQQAFLCVPTGAHYETPQSASNPRSSLQLLVFDLVASAILMKMCHYYLW
mmetsp:Transcript_24108/g.66607  ORF Transcript_24108/g.66607 Transcript_24108/m.66607 type:complete len:88 (-) Transcript_24108:82-345(-)